MKEQIQVILDILEKQNKEASTQETREAARNLRYAIAYLTKDESNKAGVRSSETI